MQAKLFLRIIGMWTDLRGFHESRCYCSRRGRLGIPKKSLVLNAVCRIFKDHRRRPKRRICGDTKTPTDRSFASMILVESFGGKKADSLHKRTETIPSEMYWHENDGRINSIGGSLGCRTLLKPAQDPRGFYESRYNFSHRV